MKSALHDLVEGYSGEAFNCADACPICGAGSKYSHPAINIHPAKPFSYDYRVCKLCDHGWIDPMPTQGLLNHLYSKGSLSVIGQGWEETELCVLTIPEQRVVKEQLGGSHPVGRYLELGVGKGNLYGAFQAAGWQCCGVEPGPWGQSYAGVFASIDAVPHSYRADVIVANDVLEHVSDPIAMMKRLNHFASDSATLYCSVPNRQSFRAVVGRTRWRMLRPLGHVHFWSRKSIIHALKQARFAVENLISTDLWLPRPIRTLKHAAAAGIERLGFGDQWIATARSHR